MAALAPAAVQSEAEPTPADASTGEEGVPERRRNSASPDSFSQEDNPGEVDNDDPDNDEGPPAQDGGTGQEVGRTDECPYVACSFLLLGPNYIAEHIELRLPVGIGVEEAINRVAAARAPSDTVRMPRVYNVHPQPRGTHALCITAPAWDFLGAIVVVDSRGINGRLFALHLAGFVNRAGLLNAAGIPQDAAVEVYIGNQPWPLVDGPYVGLCNGELVLIVSPRAHHHVIAGLQDMLASVDGWDPAFDPSRHLYGGFIAHTWLMSDDASGFFILQPERRRQVRQDIAFFLNVSSRELVIQAAHLTAQDFAYKGVAASTVLAALRSTEFLPSYRSRPVICFIDARAVLLTITWQALRTDLQVTVLLVMLSAFFVLI